MREILILSGKGGTGKTTMVGSLAALVPNKVLADCDVDAADLHLLLNPKIKKETEFWSGVTAEMDPSLCTACGICEELCQFDAIKILESAEIDPLSCEGCGVCAEFCPEEAINLKDNLCGSWFISDTDYGPMVYAQLGIGEENSGKLVSLVKKEAKAIAEKIKAEWILVDGSPGIGCPVIASLAGADLILVVTEPTTSGLHDLNRVVDLAEYFKIPTCVCINKGDLNQEVAEEIRKTCLKRQISMLGMIPFDPEAVSSVVAGKPLVENSDGPSAMAIREIWKKLEKIALDQKKSKSA
jgi:MinD superfamily P-loop ATPase